jgi:hypothetical protein
LLNGRPLGKRKIQAKEKIFYNARENIFNNTILLNIQKNLVVKSKISGFFIPINY